MTPDRATILANAGSSQNLQEHVLLQILLDVQRAILTTNDSSGTAKIALSQIHKLIPRYHGGMVTLFGEGQEPSRIIAIDGEIGFFSVGLHGEIDLADYGEDLKSLETGLAVIENDLIQVETPGGLQLRMSTMGVRSYLVVPLRFMDRLIGALFLASNEADVFIPETARMAQVIADSMAIAIQQAHSLESEQQGRREAEIMRDVMTRLASTVDLNQVFEVILRYLAQVVHYDRASLYLLNQYNQYRLPEIHQEGSIGPTMFPIDDPVIAEIRERKKPLIIQDIQDDPRFRNWKDMELVHGWMGVPLFIDEKLFGIISLGQIVPAAFSISDAEVVQIFANQLNDVLEKASLYEASHRRAEELELITSFSLALRQADNQENILVALMEQVTTVFGATEGAFLMLEPDRAALLVTFSYDQALIGRRYIQGSDHYWHVVNTGQPLYIEKQSDVQANLNGDIDRELLKDARSVAILPLSTMDAIFGLLCFTFIKEHEFSAEDQRLFLAISEIAGTALRRAAMLETLEEQVLIRNRHLSTLYEISSLESEPEDLIIQLKKILSITLDALKNPMGSIHLIDDRTKSLLLVANLNLPKNMLPVIESLPLQGAFWKSLISSNEPVVIPDLPNDPHAPIQLKGLGVNTFLSAPIRAKGQCLGLMSIFGDEILDYTIEDIALFSTIAEQIGGVVERSKLQKQAERAAVAEERQRLARELHDSISQLLYSLVLYAGAGRKVLTQGDLDQTQEYLKRIDQASLQALKEMRLMVYELRPSVFHEEGLVGALERRLQAVEKRTGIDALLVVEGDISLDEAEELGLYRIAEEALNNTLKHADASRVEVKIARQRSGVVLSVTDDGTGFNLDQAAHSGGLGITGIQERVNQLGGELEIQSVPGSGTKIKVYLEIKE